MTDPPDFIIEGRKRAAAGDVVVGGLLEMVEAQREAIRTLTPHPDERLAFEACRALVAAFDGGVTDRMIEALAEVRRVVKEGREL